MFRKDTALQEQNLDVNLVIQAFQDRVNQLMTEMIVKDATIKQLTAQIEQLNSPNQEQDKKDK